MEYQQVPATPRRAMGSRLVCATPRKGKAIVNYSLGEKIGKGAFASVYKAIDLKTGGVVAIKQIPTRNFPSVDAVMGEIELLQHLEHPNIVKYLGYMKMDDTLHIVLEYCENGSLAATCNKFGVFPENLLAMYMGQVLEGLEYLHLQGTIHRDIKGANILTTKDGKAKLADFGVATTTVKPFDEEVGLVGTPHWMAPEIIQLQEPTTACDIWSLGCTIVELRTGKPPHGELADFAAMYAIVQDDEPPIPAEASRSLRDFLVLCFQKDPNLRMTAKDLRAHAWIRKHMCETVPSDATTKVQRWNSPTHKLRMQVPSRLNLREAFADISNINTSSVKKAKDKDLLTFVDSSETFDDGFATFSSPFGVSPDRSPATQNTTTVPFPSTLGSCVNEEQRLLPKVALRPVDVYKNDDEDAFDDFDNGQVGLALRARDPVPSNHTVDGIDPFSGIAEILDDMPLERVAAAQEEAKKLVVALHKQKDHQLGSIYVRLAELMAAEPSVKKLLVQNKILSSALQSLSQDYSLAGSLLDFVSLLVHGDESLLETFSLSGGVDALIYLSSTEPLRCVNLLCELCESYSFGARLLMSRKETMEVLSGCLERSGGYKDKGSSGSDVAGRICCKTAECMLLILQSFGPRKRAEIWYHFNKFGFFEKILKCLEVDEGHPALPHLYALISSLAKSPPEVVAICVGKHSLRMLMRAYRHLSMGSPYRLCILHFYKDVSTNASVLESMEKGGLGPYFVQVLRETYKVRTNTTHAAAACLLPMFYNFCRISFTRQADAAKWGLISLLQKTASAEPSLKEFSIPLICAMAHNKDAWDELWKVGGLETLVKLLRERGWEAQALAALTAWMSRQPERIFEGFKKLGGLDILVAVVRDTRAQIFAAVVTSLATLMDYPTGVSTTIDASALFDSLKHHIEMSQTSTTLVKILRVVRSVLDAQEESCNDLVNCGLNKLISNLQLREELPIMCKRVARQICSIANKKTKFQLPID